MYGRQTTSEQKECDEDFDSSSGCELSFEMSNDTASPEVELRSRRLDFGNEGTPGPKLANFSPPYKRVRALRLFDSPLTPKTIIKKSSTATPVLRCRLFNDKPKAVTTSYAKLEKPLANINPFTPDAILRSKKRTRSILSSPEEPKLKQNEIAELEIEHATKKIALQESNISRYHQEFLEIELIGRGQFGSVYKCINRLDGCTYAVKKSTKPVAGSFYEKTALNEVYAHAVLGKHQHVVRYYSAWAEDNHMIIQNEYCNGGSLAEKISNEALSAVELRRFLLHVAEGLRYIHSEGLVHLDIKPANIFISKEKKINITNYDSADDGFEEIEEQSMCEEEITYKIGDLGHVTSINNPQVEEGDCRYLPREILEEDYSHLSKADVFALGLSALECAGYGSLPKNGEAWHRLRKGEMPKLPQKLPRDLILLIESMINPNPMERPSASQVLQHRALCPESTKSKAELTRELNAEKLRNEMLVKQLKEAAMCIKTIASDQIKLPQAVKINSRLIGKKFHRSVSSTNF